MNPMYRGRECTESRTFEDATGTGIEWRFPADSATGAPWPVGRQWCARQHDVCTRTPEEIAAAAAEEQRRMREEARLAKLREIREKIKAGTDTQADRTKALKLLIGVVLGLAAEDGE